MIFGDVGHLGAVKLKAAPFIPNLLLLHVPNNLDLLRAGICSLDKWILQQLTMGFSLWDPWVSTLHCSTPPSPHLSSSPSLLHTHMNYFPLLYFSFTFPFSVKRKSPARQQAKRRGVLLWKQKSSADSINPALQRGIDTGRMLQCKPEDEQHMYQLILTAGNLVSRTLEVILIALSGPVLESYLGFRLLSNRWFQLVPRKAGSLCFIHGAPGVPGLGAAPTKLQETCLNPCNPIDAGAISASNNVRKWITWTEKAGKANVHLYLERKKNQNVLWEIQGTCMVQGRRCLTRVQGESPIFQQSFLTQKKLFIDRSK